SGALVSAEICGCGAVCTVTGEADKFICCRQALHPEEVPLYPARPTKTVLEEVAATRTGPELASPGTPPTLTLLPAAVSGSIKYTLCAPKSATTNCDASGVSAAWRINAFGGGPPGGRIPERNTPAVKSKTSKWSMLLR